MDFLRVTAGFALAAFLSVHSGGFGIGEAHAQADRKLLLMHYMPWYQTPEVSGRWGEHWTGWERQHNPDESDRNGLADIWSAYRPLMGPYDSADPDALECHLLQMKLAGIDGVIADWYGISDVADYPPIHTATEALFEKAGELDMQFAACFEDRTVQNQIEKGALAEDRVREHLAETFAWMDAQWFGAEHYVKKDGRPLLLNFGPIFVHDGEVWDAALEPIEPRPALHALNHVWKNIDADGGFTWVYKSAWEGEPSDEEIERRLNREFTHYSADPAQIIVSATPGFKDIYATSYGYLPHRGGETLEESLSLCMEGEWPIVQLVTWNDYGEGTMIEPTHEFGYRFLEIIQEARREESGGAFAFDAEDLRLPLRLYRLRKEGGADDEALDRVAELLSAGRCDEAAARLGELENR